MSATTSATTGRRYGLKRVVSHVGEVALGALRAAGAFAAPSAGCAAGAPRADTRAVRCAVAGGHSH